MALRKIIQEGNDTLRKHSRPVTEFDKKLDDLLDDMKQTLKKADGVGLAAPQVGILRRIFVIETGDENKSNVVEFINPVLLEAKGEQYGDEGCLSVPGVRGKVRRPQTVKIKAQNRYGEEFKMTLTDLSARCFCHENDHLDGVLFIDKAEEKEEYDEE